ncbi:MAG: hypothetical protein SOT71_12520 [Romboutsia timonensis]|uniref:hypothetical protein n=1 Tax=Romboutsia timonensis TaxID=1776391 RepID=UPI002A764DA0|nr:hypothetical protein [Romboutsia timonensis]MDY2883465.1 hypothetical protein [Romboutsia timonensis]
MAKKMQIKLDLSGELLTVLQEISEEECRSCTQQVLYILKKHLKDDINALKMRKSVASTSEIIKTHEEELKLTNSEIEEVSIEKNTTNTVEIVEEKEQAIDDDILDFFN